MLHVPGVSDRRVTVAKVTLVRTCENPFCERIATRDDQIVGREVELLDRQGHDRKIRPIARLRARQLLNKGGRDRFVLEKTALLRWNRVDHAENVRLRKDQEELFEDAFGAAVKRKPIVHDSDFASRRGAHHSIFTISLSSWQMQPTVFSMENLSRALSRAIDDTFAANSGSWMILPTARASAAGSAGGTRKPSCPSVMISSTPPPRVATTGVPASMASTITRPNGSAAT